MWVTRFFDAAHDAVILAKDLYCARIMILQTTTAPVRWIMRTPTLIILTIITGLLGLTVNDRAPVILIGGILIWLLLAALEEIAVEVCEFETLEGGGVEQEPNV